MEMQLFDDNKSKIKNKPKSMKKMENNEKSEKPKKSNLYCFQNKLFMTVSCLIYISFLYLFFKKLSSNPKESNKNLDKKTNSNENTNKNIYTFDTTNLNYIENLLNTLKPNNPSYIGPIFPSDGKITKEWVLELINFMKDLENKKTYKDKYIDKIYLLQMLLKSKNIFKEYQEALIDIHIPEGKNITVVGDIHGQFYDLLHIFEINGYPSEENIYLFNGDYVDRGVFGVECLITLISFKILYPNYVFMSRGNHEDRAINRRYGFKNEVIDKYDEKIFNCFSEFFKFLPLGHIINKEVLVIHGGLFSQEGVTLDDLRKINRFQEIPFEGLMCELLWSDPYDGKGTRPSRRGAGVNFGPDVTEKFLKENNLKLLIRSHEVRQEGYQIETGGKVITLFSAPNYCDRSGNKGALIKFNGGDMSHPIFIKFNSSPHPNISIYKYIS